MTPATDSTYYPPVANPFAVQAIQPGAIPYFFWDSQNDTEGFVKRFQIDFRGRGAIVGPHGSGKSTLLATLRDPLLSHFAKVQWHRAAHGQAPRLVLDPRSDLLVIDGFEQFSVLKRLSIAYSTRIRHTALLVTAHKPQTGIPTLFGTEVNPQVIRHVVTELLQDHPERVARYCRQAEEGFARSGNLRETLFELYDRYEGERPVDPMAEHPTPH